MEQLVDDIGIFLRKSSSYLGSGVLGGYRLADQYQTHDGFLTPLIKIQLRIFLLSLDFRICIIHQCSQFFPFLPGQIRSEDLFDMRADHTGSTLEHMDKRLMLPVQVTEKIFRSLRQRQDRVAVYDFLCCRFYIRIFLGQMSQQVLIYQNQFLLIGSSPIR